MNDRDDKSTERLDEARLDRLVDGELPADEYRRVLAALDEEPGGWKRCALAFLEAQALAGELGALRRGADRPPERGGETHVTPAHRSKGRPWPALFAMAASFLAAFGLGVVAPQFFPSPEQDRPLTGNYGPQTPPTGGDADVVHQTWKPIGNLRLVMDGRAGEATQTGQVPVYEVSPDLDPFLASSQPALGPELIDYLEQHGYEVRHEQQYFPAPLDDGRQIIVPVDGYQITPVGRKY